LSNETRLSKIIAGHIVREGPLLPILHDTQATFGCIDRAAEAQIAQALNLSRAEVHGVVSFYHDFRAPDSRGGADPRPEVQICRAEACQARGVEALVAAAEKAAKVNGVERVRLKTVYCLGLCSVGPAARMGNAVHARLDEAGLVRLIEAA
jgi:formate dehydrogenase subunit gamma